MSEQGILGVFSTHAFLKGLSEQHRMVLASGVRPFKAAAGEMLAREGDTAKSLFLVQVGRVAIEAHQHDRGATPIMTVGPGDIVGWSWIVPPYRWQFDARVLEPTTGLAFDAQWLRDKCEQDHELGYRLLREFICVLAARVNATRLQILDAPG